MDELNAGSNSKKQNRERFVRIAEARVNRVLEALASLEACSNTRNYEYSEKDVKKMFGEIDKKLREVRLMYQETPKGTKKFKLEP